MLSLKNKNELEKLGYTIIPNVMNINECNKSIDMIWNWLENLKLGLDKNDNKTWKVTPKGGWPQNLHGIIQHYQVGQSKFVWDIRTHKNVIKVFKELWNDNDLLVSFDGACIMKPPTEGGSTYSSSWLHVDQGPKKKGLHCIQGFMNLEETTENDGSMVIIPGSHKYHSKMFEKNGKIFSQDWYKLKEDDLKYIYELKLKKKRLVIPKGAMVLWDSRTIHCNCPPTKKSKNFRYVVYICMTPKKMCNEFNLKKRIKAFEEIRMTTHWPHHVKLFPKNARTYGVEYPPYNIKKKPIKLKNIGMKLVGY